MAKTTKIWYWKVEFLWNRETRWNIINKEKICEYIKEYLETDFDIDYNDIDISITTGDIFGISTLNERYIVEKLTLKSKQYGYYFTIESNCLNDKSLSYESLSGYNKVKQIYFKEKEKENHDKEYKKKHPILYYLKQ